MCRIQNLLDEAKKHIDKIDFKNIVKLEGPGDYSIAEGKARMTVLGDFGKAEVIHTHLEPGTNSEYHYHDQKEIYVCYNGTVTFNDIKVLAVGDLWYTNPGDTHKVSSKEGADMLIIRIPSSGMSNHGR